MGKTLALQGNLNKGREGSVQSFAITIPLYFVFFFAFLLCSAVNTDAAKFTNIFMLKAFDTHNQNSSVTHVASSYCAMC